MSCNDWYTQVSVYGLVVNGGIDAPEGAKRLLPVARILRVVVGTRQRLNDLKCGFCIFIGGTQPSNHGSGTLVDSTHHADLLASFLEVKLIDAYGVDPDTRCIVFSHCAQGV